MRLFPVSATSKFMPLASQARPWGESNRARVPTLSTKPVVEPARVRTLQPCALGVGVGVGVVLGVAEGEGVGVAE